jgi:hypothetical protein
MNIAQLIAAASAANEDTAEARKAALPATVIACRMVEKMLQDALGNEPLRGLKNLIARGGPRNTSFYGARVRAKPDKAIEGFVSATPNQSALCIDAHGRLVNARWVVDPEHEADDGTPWWVLEVAPASDDDLKIGDADGLLKALQVVLPRHVAATRRVRARYLEAELLASRIQNSMESDPSR